jgi:hypothetical protein
MDAILARSIRARGHYTTLFRAATDGESLSNERWIMLLFDGAEKSIEIKMNDRAWHGGCL